MEPSEELVATAVKYSLAAFLMTVLVLLGLLVVLVVF